MQTKPFNLDHAKAGAPYACRNGEILPKIKAKLVPHSGESLYNIYRAPRGDNNASRWDNLSPELRGVWEYLARELAK